MKAAFYEVAFIFLVINIYIKLLTTLTLFTIRYLTEKIKILTFAFNNYKDYLWVK
ncbi:hypothetical protein M2138_000037 [Dysgonomonadaceae bacterium PH5-43]|nr:hypothetical protein [Dysgonomonadaceae bacterium PH5-43]